MGRPTECKWCGCGEIRSETDSAIHFKCFSSYWHDGDEWNIATNCAAKCAVQLVERRERVQRAVEVLASLPHSLMTPFWREKYLSQMTPDQRQLADAVDKVIEILKRETDGKAD